MLDRQAVRQFVLEVVRELKAIEAEKPASIRPRLLTVTQAAEYLGLTKSAMWKKIHHGKVRVMRDGRSVRLCREDLDSYIDRNRD